MKILVRTSRSVHVRIAAWRPTDKRCVVRLLLTKSCMPIVHAISEFLLITLLQAI